jgi:uncharacterized protein (TIGR02271 family)
VNEQPGHGGGEGRPRDESQEDPTLVLHEERARVDKRWEGVGYAGVRRQVDAERVREQHPRGREQITQERVPVDESDSGKIETLADGSISIPLFDEELVVTHKTVLRERVIIRKEVITDWETVEAELRRERVTFDTDDVPAGSVTGIAHAAGQSTARRSTPIETKPFFLTSEFLFLLLALLGLMITTLASDALDARSFWLLTVALVAGYVLSRSLAKADSEHRGWTGN